MKNDVINHFIYTGQQMFFKKYKILKNNGLLPKIYPSKAENIITSYCLLNDQKQHLYSLVRSPSDRNLLIMFNDKEYLHRKCSYIANDNNSAKVLNEISPLFPRHTHTLTIFIVNAPGQCDGILLGSHSKQLSGKPVDSLIAMAYKDIIANKSQQSTIRLSIVGIESQNSLTDQLNLEWLDQHQEKENSTPLQIVIKSKQKVKVLKERDSDAYYTENLTHHNILSQLKLREILQKYKDVKNHLQDWIISTESPQYYLLGELYHLSQIKAASEDHPEVILQSHYMLRINQYFRMASPLMLRLGIHLRRAEQEHLKPMEMHESKLFKLLSDCFSQAASNSKIYRFHLFLQVGEYPNLKDQYLCLVPTSQYLHKNQASTLINILQSEFFYTKQIMEYPELHAMINTLITNEKPDNNKNSFFLPQISEMLRARLKTKSYVCDTYSSQEKRISKYRHLLTEESNDRSQMDLEELVYEAAKIYRLPSPKKNPTIFIKENLSKIQKPRKNASLFEKSRQSVDKETNFEKRRKDQNIQGSKKDLPQKRFYEQTKSWLGLIYGKNSSKKLQSANKRVQRFDQTTNMLIKDILSKEINYTANEEIDEVIDRL